MREGGRKRRGNGGGWEDRGRWGGRTVFGEGQGGGARGERELCCNMKSSTLYTHSAAPISHYRYLLCPVAGAACHQLCAGSERQAVCV